MPADQASPMPAVMPTSCSNPDALGVSRVDEIDTTSGPGFGLVTDLQINHSVMAITAAEAMVWHLPPSAAGRGC
jgi:hypothetical protein